MLAAASRRFPRSGPWGIGLIGFAGAMAIYFVLPQLGKIYDDAKMQKAGGKEAFDALQPGSTGLQQALSYAAEQSFQTIAIIPVLLFFIFGLAAGLLRSEMRLPAVVYEMISMLLLLTIGLKGGIELAKQPFEALALQALAVMAMGAILVLIAFPVLRLAGRFDANNAALL